MNKTQEILKQTIEKGFLLDKSILDYLTSLENLEYNLILNLFFHLNLEKKLINKQNLEKISNNISKNLKFKENPELFIQFFNFLEINLELNLKNEENKKIESKNEDKTSKNFKVLFSPTILPKKISVQDFVSHFRARYNQLKSILMEKNLEDLKSIRKIGNERGNYSIIVSIIDKKTTKNGNILLTVEDLNGTASVLAAKTKEDVFLKASEVLLDEVVALNVSGNSEFLFLNDIIYPDTSIYEKKRLPIEESIAFISDIHVGSNMFYEKNFLKFIKWLNGEEGDEEQRKIAKKVKYLLIIGDTVDGVGVFPDQEKFLELKDIKLQYKKLAEILSLIRKDVEIIISPGQHDAVWVGEPQPIIGEEWAPELFEMENVTLVTNPAMIEIQNSFKILMYHGASMHGIIEEIEDIRLNYGHKSPTRVVKEMLKRRHLSPMHGLCDYVPNETQDMMVINQIPDLVCTGDQHRTEISSYNNILLVSSSCWQAKTPFEEKVGNEPDPCKVPIYNLKTREVKILDFSSDE